MATAAGAAQLPGAFILWWIVASTVSDDYNAGYGGAFGLLCLFVLAPLYLPVLGLLHAAAHTMPATVLARRAPGPRWARHLLGTALLGVFWAAVTALLWDGPFLATAVSLAALGVLPALAVAYARRRARVTGQPWGLFGAWWRAALAVPVLCVAAFGGGALATVTGLIEEYEPPVLSAARLTGEWHGDDGAVLRLRSGGRAEVTRLPAEGEFAFGADEVYVRCDGYGTWQLDREGRYDTYTGKGPEERDGVVVRLDGGCRQETYWTIGGTEHEPELFVRFGDPDAGELWILAKAS
ncbi:hypothetical protein C4B68_22760 [Streptomyces dengpaensis]|uniref:Uncharacterized protein n=2 Tax=Streptomyces TaxID=1883 RepID=A0ABN5IDT8_9ACTN|nr:hypothetical protein C4B68_22760 [Streptomyces dengpaensis]